VSGATQARALAAGLPAAAQLSGRWHLGEVIFWLSPVAAYFLFPDNLVLLAQMAIIALFALSLDLVLGYGGIISLGHAAFFGIGAYAAGLLARHGWGEPLSGLAVAALAAGAGGLLSGLLLLRGNDLTRLMVTLGVAMMLFEAANRFPEITGGVDGLQGIEMAPLFGRYPFDLYGKTAYVYAVAVLFVVFVLLRRLVRSPFGLCLRGIKGNARRMPALGCAVDRHLLAAYSMGAAVAGIAGALLAQTTEFVALDVLSFHRSAELLLILVFGGAGHLYGALLGTVAFMLAQHLLSGMEPQYWQFWLGAILVTVVLYARDGIIGALHALRRRLQAAPDRWRRHNA